jgi:hypothetical protein
MTTMVEERPRTIAKPAATEQRPRADVKFGVKLTEEQLRARRARSIAIALALGAFVLLIFAVTIVKLGGNVFTGPDYMRPVQSQD